VRIAALLAALALALPAPGARAAAEGPAPVERTIQAGGLTRRYWLVLPEGAPAGRRPLVFVLHGHGGSARQALGRRVMGRGALSRWPDIARREGVIVAAPDGLRGPDHLQGWNDCRADAGNNPASDDVAFLDALAKELIETERADPARVFVMGMSNGAMMAFRAALEMSPAPAAIAAVSGLMARNNGCRPAKAPVSLLLIEGTADAMVPYDGGAVGYARRWTPEDRGQVLSAAQTADFWVKADGLKGEPRRSEIPHVHADDPTTAFREDWGAPEGPQVSVITVRGGGHVEPSPTRSMGYLYNRFLGPQNRDFEAADAAWAFFKDKRRP
jgi:polyhydroxybutyrate depolymerase